MKQKLLLGFLLLILVLRFPLSGVKAQSTLFAYEQTVEVEAKKVDNRAIMLRDYLNQYNSPLADHAQDFSDAADEYQVDWKLVPSIAGVESTFGKRTPGSDLYPSYNAWGWGVYGSQSLGFKSWRDGIFTVTKGLKENYINKGYTEPYSMNRIYAASPTWGVRVSYFMANLDTYVQNYNFPVDLARIDPTAHLPKTENLQPTLANNTHNFKLSFIN